jgi:ketosteroid isomerase-like protein
MRTEAEMQMDTREIIDRYFDYVNSGRWDDYLALFADDIVMDEQLMGHVEGIDQVRKSTAALRDYPGFRNEPREKVVEGDRAVVICHITSPLPDGSRIEADVANFYRMRDGKIAYFANYHDTAPFQAVAHRASVAHASTE